MTNWTALSRESHSKFTWIPRNGFGFAARSQSIEVLMNEISNLIPHYTLGFVQSGDSYRFAALLGLGGEQNLYVNSKNQWCCQVVPRVIQSFPFTHLKNHDTGEYILCIREDHLSDSHSGEPLFTEEGELDSNVHKIAQFLEANEINRAQTAIACDKLAAAGLIEPWPIEVGIDENKDPLKISGFNRISEQALNALSPDSLAELRDCGALLLAYGHFFSSGNIQQMQVRLETLAKEFTELDAANKKTELFDDEGTINFDALDDSGIL